MREISSLDEIKTLVLKNVNVRDEESIADLHKLGLDISVTTYNANTVDRLKITLVVNGQIRSDCFCLIMKISAV